MLPIRLCNAGKTDQKLHSSADIKSYLSPVSLFPFLISILLVQFFRRRVQGGTVAFCQDVERIRCRAERDEG